MGRAVPRLNNIPSRGGEFGFGVRRSRGTSQTGFGQRTLPQGLAVSRVLWLPAINENWRGRGAEKYFLPSVLIVWTVRESHLILVADNLSSVSLVLIRLSQREWVWAGDVAISWMALSHWRDQRWK